jgi:hypothetical protein
MERCPTLVRCAHQSGLPPTIRDLWIHVLPSIRQIVQRHLDIGRSVRLSYEPATFGQVADTELARPEVAMILTGGQRRLMTWASVRPSMQPGI